MTASDIIAIVAITISAIVSVISAIITYKNNKANILAKRSEMSFEKRLEAYRELIESMGKLTLQLQRISLEFNNKKRVKELSEDGRLLLDSFFTNYTRYRIFMPKNIFHILTLYLGASSKAMTLVISNKEQFDLSFNDALDKEGEIVSLIQKNIGL